MDKEALIQTLKEKTGVDNLSERTIDEVATILLPQFADDTKITDESWALPVQMVKTMSGQLRHDLSGGISAFKTQYETEQKAVNEKAVAEAIAAAKEEWEKNHQTPAPQKPDADIEARIADAVAKATGEQTKAFETLSKQFSDYMKAQEAKEKAATEAGVRSQIRNYLLDRGVDEDDFALEYTLEKLVVGENPDVEVLKVKAEKDYEATYKKIHKVDGGQPFNGGEGGRNDSNADFQNYIKNKQTQAAQEAKDAEELKKYMM